MNTSLLSRKPFLDYEHQIQYLKKKKLIISDKTFAIQTLNQIGYYSLITGYKDIFKDSNTNDFFNGTTFEDIYLLYRFDAELRALFLKYILIIEKHIKSSISYHFSTLYGNGLMHYLNPQNYDYGKHFSEIQIFFQKINHKIKGKYASVQVKHYMSIYHDVPLWVLNTDLTFGEIATMYRFLKGKCKIQVCKDFHEIEGNALNKMLILLTKYRNICAHGNRLYNCHIQDSILDNIAHKKLSIPCKKSLYTYGKSDLFAVVISLKYLLSPQDFREFYYLLKKIIQKYSPNENILYAMGFPQNWKSILRIKVYKI